MQKRQYLIITTGIISFNEIYYQFSPGNLIVVRSDRKICISGKQRDGVESLQDFQLKIGLTLFDKHDVVNKDIIDQKMKILVTGGAAFIGSNFIHMLRIWGQVGAS